MFSMYRRHESSCPFKKKGIRHTSCPCPIWMDGTNDRGKRVRQSLKTRDWRHAQDIVDRLEAGTPANRDPVPQGVTVHFAAEAYIRDCEARNLAPGTVASYKKLLEHLQEFFPKRHMGDIDVDSLSKFRESREVTSGTAIKELSSLRAFFGFCLARKWVVENSASSVKAPRHVQIPTMPFTDKEVALLVDACDRIDNPNQREIPRARLRARALILLLLYSGLRISDAVQLKRTSLDRNTGKLFLRMMKTKASLYVTIPPVAITALEALPVESDYFFWSGTAKLSTAVGSARRTVECVTKLAGVADGHPHRFRDTFSVKLLESGEDLRTVQLLLGHTSIKTTEKHYAPFVSSMQKRLDEAVGKLQFGLAGEIHVNAPQDTLRDAKGNVLPFRARKKRGA